jgi:hypothetical protein
VQGLWHSLNREYVILIVGAWHSPRRKCLIVRARSVAFFKQEVFYFTRKGRVILQTGSVSFYMMQG